MRNEFARWIAIAAIAMLTGCQTVRTTQPGVVGVDRPQRMLISSEEMNRGAAEAYLKVQQDAAKKGQLNRDPAQTERVRRIASRLIPSTSFFRPDARSWKWEVNVINSDEVNAWCMPGGKIGVYSGLISKLNISDDELAAVMGHEIAHALREHSREQASLEHLQGAVIGIGGALLGLSDAAQNLGQLVADYAISRPHSRQDETEADRIGVELAARSGFDPRASVTLWQKMGRLGGGQPPQWMSTHPSNETRSRDLQDYSQRVLPLYESERKK